MLRVGYPILLNSAWFSVLSALRVSDKVYVVRVEVRGGQEQKSLQECFLWQLTTTDEGWMTSAVLQDQPPQDEDGVEVSQED
mmetsp:Transcript_73529/g.239275  ORF Transcript_73529/g.239275 Transcript_73529/m.239275 type:complete len:82 (+) Transcript_73529:1011-1256(+)